MLSIIDQSINLSRETATSEAANRTAADRAALAPEAVLQMNADAAAIGSRVLGVLPGLHPYRAQFEKATPLMDLEQFDKLETYAVALLDLQGAMNADTLPVDLTNQLATAAASAYGVLLAEANALVSRELLDPEVLKSLPGTNGYRNTGISLRNLSIALQTVYPQIQGKCAVTAEELTYATKLGTLVLRSLGERDEVRADRAAERNRAFTLVFRAYEEVRRALHYLRWHEGDADEIAPSLFDFGNRPKKEAVKPAAASSSATPAPAPAATPATAPSTEKNLGPDGSPFA